MKSYILENCAWKCNSWFGLLNQDSEQWLGLTCWKTCMAFHYFFLTDFRCSKSRLWNVIMVFYFNLPLLFFLHLFSLIGGWCWWWRHLLRSYNKSAWNRSWGKSMSWQIRSTNVGFRWKILIVKLFCFALKTISVLSKTRQTFKLIRPIICIYMLSKEGHVTH